MPRITRRELLKVIDLCMTVEKKGVDPFEVDVRRTLERLRRYLPRWKLLEDLLLDAEAVAKIASIIKLQKDWIIHRSSSLYIDPLLVELKVKMMEKEGLAECFLRSRRPIISLEQLSKERMEEAVAYWNQLLPLEERFGEEEAPEAGKMGLLSPEDLVDLRIVSPEEFRGLLEGLWEELKATGRTPYKDFVYTDSFEETLDRAYLVSFLVSGGFAEMEVKPLEEEIFLIPRKRPISMRGRRAYSIPIAIDYEDWRRHKGG